MVDVADRLRVMFGSESLDFLEGETRTGRDDQEVVVEQRPVAEFHLVLLGMHALRTGGRELDALSTEVLGHRKLDVVALAPVHGDPRIGRDEVERRCVRDDGDAVAWTSKFLHFVGHGHAAQARADDHDVRHGIFLRRPFTSGSRPRGPSRPSPGRVPLSRRDSPRQAVRCNRYPPPRRGAPAAAIHGRRATRRTRQ